MSSARGSIALYRGGRLWNWVLSDRARALLGHAVLYLDATARPDDPRSGLTATRLKALCVETGICSAGRAGAMLGLMRMGRYVAPASAADDRRVRRLVPTERLLEMQRVRLKYQFEALAMLLPEGRDALRMLGRTGSSAQWLARSVIASWTGFGCSATRPISCCLPSAAPA